MKHITGGLKGPPKPSTGARTRGAVVTWNSSFIIILKKCLDNALYGISFWLFHYVTPSETRVYLSRIKEFNLTET